MYRVLVLSFLVGLIVTVAAQEQSVKPGINDAFKNPDVTKYAKTFEGESREVFLQRDKVVAACGLKSGMVVADVGAGTGLYTRLFAKAVGADGQVLAVDIAPKFLEHIQKSARDAGLKNVSPVLCNFDSVDLPPNSVDVAFICDTYHHFEFPQRTMLSLHRALKPNGKLVVIDFIRIPGKSTDWVLNHVRAGQEVVEKEIALEGFKKTDEVKDLLKENYFVIFTKQAKAVAPPKMAAPQTPIIPGYGAVVPLPTAPEGPVKGSKFVFDTTSVGKDSTKPAPGLERVATLLNLAGVSGLQAGDVTVSVVLHGDTTFHALTNDAYQAAQKQPHPSADLLAKLHQAGVKIMVCGQSLHRKNLDPKTIRPGIIVTASAVTAVANLQHQGYAYIPAHNP